MAIWDKKPEDDDFLAPRAAAQSNEEQPIQTHALAELAVDSGIIDITPSTQSIEIVTEDERATRIVVPTTEPTSDTGPISRRSNYSRRDSLRGEAFDQPEPAAMRSSLITRKLPQPMNSGS